jgi:hypothetical protein
MTYLTPFSFGSIKICVNLKQMAVADTKRVYAQKCPDTTEKAIFDYKNGLLRL